MNDYFVNLIEQFHASLVEQYTDAIGDSRSISRMIEDSIFELAMEEANCQPDEDDDKIAEALASYGLLDLMRVAQRHSMLHNLTMYTESSFNRALLGLAIFEETNVEEIVDAIFHLKEEDSDNDEEESTTVLCDKCYTNVELSDCYNKGFHTKDVSETICMKCYAK